MHEIEQGDVHARLRAGARKLFLRDGFAKTDVSRIVKEARTSKRAFYQHYADRESAFLELVQDLLQEQNRTSAFPEGHPDVLLEQLAKSYYVANLNPDSLGLFRASTLASIRTPELDVKVHRARALAMQPMADKMRHWQECGLLTFDDPLLAALRFGFLATDGLKPIMGCPPLSGKELDIHAARVSHLFLHGVAPHELRLRPHAFTSPHPATGPRPLAATGDDDSSRLPSAVWDRIYEVAWQEFQHHGYSGSSIERIARNCGTAKTTIYRRHATKVALFEAIMLRRIDQVYAGILQIKPNSSPATDALNELAIDILNVFISPDSISIHKILLMESGNIPNSTRNLYTKIVEYFSYTIRLYLEFYKIVNNEEGSGSIFSTWSFFVLVTFGGRLIFNQPHTDTEIHDLCREATRLFLFGSRAA